MSDDRDEVRRDFHELVNMAPAERERWLGTDESRSVVRAATGRRSRTRGARSRWVTRRAGGDLEGSRWRFSPMNWGHDPLK